MPWDYDGTFGRSWAGTPFPSTAWLSNHLLDRLLGDPAYRRRFAARWHELRGRQFSTAAIEEMIDANVRTLGEAARRNALRWPAAGGGYPDRVTFGQDVAEMKIWLKNRLAWLDQQTQRFEDGKAK